MAECGTGHWVGSAEQVEVHVLLLFLFNDLGCLRGASASVTGGGPPRGSCRAATAATTAAAASAELAEALLDHVSDRLALHLGDDPVEHFVFNFDAASLKDFLYVLSLRGLLATNHRHEVRTHVFHRHGHLP